MESVEGNRVHSVSYVRVNGRVPLYVCTITITNAYTRAVFFLLVTFPCTTECVIVIIAMTCKSWPITSNFILATSHRLVEN